MGFDLNPFNPIIELVGKVIDKAIPDPAAKAKAQLELLKLQQEGAFREEENALTMAMGQIAVNTEEAKSGSLFLGGWRPFIGWTCGSGLFYQFLLRNILGWIMENAGGWSYPPALEMETLVTLTFGMLGLGAYRSYEKVKGVASK